MVGLAEPPEGPGDQGLVEGTSTSTTSPGLRLLIEVRLIAKEIERGVVNQKGDLGGLSRPSVEKADLNGISPRGEQVR